MKVVFEVEEEEDASVRGHMSLNYVDIVFCRQDEMNQVQKVDESQVAWQEMLTFHLSTSEYVDAVCLLGQKTGQLWGTTLLSFQVG